MENQIDDQQKLMEVAMLTKERVSKELPYLENLVAECGKEHESIIAPLCGMMRSFAIFCNTEDNVKLLELVSELYASYAYAKKNKDSLERRNSKSIINTLKSRKEEIETAKRKGMDVEFHFDFFPLVRQYFFLLIRGHHPSNEENDICKEIMKLMGEVAKRELDIRYTALKTCEKVLN